MSRIVFDARMAGHPGIGRYIRSLLRAILEENPPHEFTLVGPAADLGRIAGGRARVVDCEVPIYGFAEQLRMPHYFRGADLVHVPHFNAPWSVPAPLVATIHDLIYLHVPDYSPFPGARTALKMQIARVCASASRIIAVSAATRDELGRLFPSASAKTRVVHEAADPLFFSKGHAVEARARFGLHRPYALYVGSIREHKNVQALLTAYERLHERAPGMADLVIAGSLDSRFDRKHRFRERAAKLPGLRHLTGVSDEELMGLYQSAECLVLPSFYEGFGLPILEAMACGTPVLASDRSSLPEIAGGAALLFDPDQIDRLSELLYNVVSSVSLRRELSSKGRQRSLQFSWTKAAKETLAVYAEALAGKGVGQ